MTRAASTCRRERSSRACGAVVVGLLVLYLPAVSVEDLQSCRARVGEAGPVGAGCAAGAGPISISPSSQCQQQSAGLLRLRGGKKQVKGKRIKQPRKIHSIEQASPRGFCDAFHLLCLLCTCFQLRTSNCC